ncbi:MAG TPA: AAA family ATPase [Blastocatellia bacterium]|nr:AAA family ATPase [Blastocatellia bacterium]
MKLDRIAVKGFKSIREMELEMRPLNVLIGANGVGKSNFIAIFRLLNQIMQGTLQVYVAQSGGADSFLYFGQKVTDKIRFRFNFGLNAYSCALLPTVDDRLIFGEEKCFFQGEGFDQPYSLSLGSGHRESLLSESVKVDLNPVAAYVLSSIQSWKVYHFHDTSDAARIKKIGAINDNQYLRPDAANLAAFLYKLQQTAPAQYERIRDTIRLVVPFFDDFILRPLPDNPNNIRLEWREVGSDYPFLAHHLSDGTLRFMCLATLLLQPELPTTILIDEPELGLHPYAITVLASLMRSASARAQIIVSTQSVSLVNQFEAEDLLVVEREAHETVIRRVDSQRLEEWLEAYSLGELWEKNVIGGRPA